MVRATSPGYNDLAESLDKLPNVSRLPEIANYVYGQSFEELKQRIDKLVGSFLFVDYGELNMSADGRNSYQVTQRIAITVASKMTNRADAAESICLPPILRFAYSLRFTLG